MNVALAQADKAVGKTAENPAVGCAIIDRMGRLIAIGHTQPSGRPHAEIMALEMAGDLAQDGTAYVTLEPCAHTGRTGPCAIALIEAGIAHVIIAAGDPDSRVCGKGIAMLEDAGVRVSRMPHLRATRQMAGFLSRHQKARPFLFMKMATSCDGFITAKQGSQTWLTGAVSKRYVHDLRSRCDVMLTTSGTIGADDPAMTMRITGYEASQPALAILDSKASLPVDAACLQAERPILLYHAKGATLKDWPSHIVPIAIAQKDHMLCLEDIVQDLYERGFGTVMVEAGATLFDSLHSANLIDELIWLQAPQSLKTGLLAWDSPDKMDFSPPNAYIIKDSFELGADKGFILHPKAS